MGLDYSDEFFACAKFRGGAKNEKNRTATYLFLVKNLGNFILQIFVHIYAYKTYLFRLTKRTVNNCT